MADTVRLTALRNLKTLLESMATPDYTFAFDSVKFGLLDEADHRQRAAAGIVVGKETKNTMFPHTECNLKVDLELKFTLDYGSGDEGPGIEAENTLGEVQRLIQTDTKLGNVVIDVRELGNEVDYRGLLDKAIMAVINLEIVYRHLTSDPRVEVH